jgi:hypothetical protein
MFGNRLVGGSSLVGALCAAGALVASCSSSNEGPPFPSFVPEDCRGGLVELARFRQTFTPSTATTQGTFNNLAIEGETLFMTWVFAGPPSPLPASGGIVAVPASGGDPRVIGAAENTSQWSTSSFWISGGQIYLQTGGEIHSVPVDAPTPSALPVILSSTLSAAYAHDAEFGYSAQADNLNGLRITKTPISGGAPTVLVEERPPNVALGGMADVGDAVLLQVRWHPEPTYDGNTIKRVWRISKDGAPHSDVRPDVDWADSLSWPQWLAWDGEDILGPIMVQHYFGMARVAAAGTSPPELLKLQGGVATRRGGEILSLQMLETRSAQRTTSRLLVASSKGAPAGSVVACGVETSFFNAVPAGIAANDSGIYVSYRDESDAVIARVSP